MITVSTSTSWDSLFGFSLYRFLYVRLNPAISKSQWKQKKKFWWQKFETPEVIVVCFRHSVSNRYWHKEQVENALILVLALFPFRLPPQTKCLEQAKLIEIAEKHIQENMIWVRNSGLFEIIQFNCNAGKFWFAILLCFWSRNVDNDFADLIRVPETGLISDVS